MRVGAEELAFVTFMVVFRIHMDASTTSAGTSADRASLLAQHLELMLHQAKAVFGGNFVMASMALLALWNFADHQRLIAWAAVVLLLTGARIAFVAAYRRAQPAAHEAARWAWMFAATSAASGLAWGSMALLFFDPAQPLSVLFVCWATAGMTTAAVPTLSNFLPAYVGFAIPRCCPTRCCASAKAARCTPRWAPAHLLLPDRQHGVRAQLQPHHRPVHPAALREPRAAGAAAGGKGACRACNAAKTKFLAAASHDLRQPTHALGLFIGALERLMQRHPGRRRRLRARGRPHAGHLAGHG